jgi:hypothetical protein
MESILAESTPRRGRAVAAAVALATIALVFVAPHHQRSRHRDRHDHHTLLRLENCRYSGYVFVAQ